MGVYKRGKRWWLAYTSPDGDYIREPVTIEGVSAEKITKTQAKDTLDIRKAQIAEGKFKLANTRNPVRFEKLVRVFIDDYSKINKKSWRRDETSSKPLLEFFQGKNLSYLTQGRVNRYKAQRLNTTSRLKKKISKATVNRELAFLKKMLNFAVEEKLLDKNPLSGYKLYPEPLTKFRTVTPEDYQKVYTEATETLKLILDIAINTGMRKSEILNLKWDNVDMNNGHILVIETKNDENRTIPINKVLNKALNSVEYRNSNGHVCQQDGTPVREFKTAFNEAIRRAGVERFTFHVLRHTFGSWLVESGADLVTVQKLMGHKTIKTTMRYLHPTTEMYRNAVEKLNLFHHSIITNKGNEA